MSKEIIKGEYWIQEDGDVRYADGDVGDVNHEGVAKEHLMALVLMHLVEVLNLDSALERLLERKSDDAHMVEDILLHHVERPYCEWQESLQADYRKHALMMAACKESTAALYCLKHLRWQRVHGSNVQTAYFDQTALKVLKTGIDNILDQEGIDGDDPVLMELYLRWYNLPDDSSFTFDLADLDTLNVTLSDREPLPVLLDDAAKAIAGKAIDKLDATATPSFYQNARHPLAD